MREKIRILEMFLPLLVEQPVLFLMPVKWRVTSDASLALVLLMCRLSTGVTPSTSRVAALLLMLVEKRL